MLEIYSDGVESFSVSGNNNSFFYLIGNTRRLVVLFVTRGAFTASSRGTERLQLDIEFNLPVLDVGSILANPFMQSGQRVYMGYSHGTKYYKM